MPSFSTTPPKDPRGVALPLLRTPPVATLRAMATSSDLIGCHTHFYHGRTMPCDVDNCKACKDGMPFRWHAWLSAKMANTHQHFLFEFTAQAAETFVQYREAHGTLRGCIFEAWRPSRRPNGRVHIRTKPGDLSEVTLPDEPNLISCLSIIWNIALVDVDVAGVLKDAPHVHVNDRLAHLYDPADGNGNGKRLET